jgi:alkyl hydroperoxide reductase subunit AhpC
LALRHDEFLAAGARIVGVSVDPPARNAAMIDKLHLPFALLSDPDGHGLLKAVDLWHPDTAHGDIGRPAVFVIHPDGAEHFRQIARDFADRITEDELLARVTSLELQATEQPPIAHVEPEPGDEAMPVRALLPYCRGAKFAAKAMGMRHPDAKADADRYIEQMDRYMAAVRELRARIGS